MPFLASPFTGPRWLPVCHTETLFLVGRGKGYQRGYE